MVILVDKNDIEIGVCEKLEAHQKGLLHRAFSILLFNNKNELLIQQRAKHKYHSPGLWTNTCCSHPLPNEDTHKAALRRLKEEMGITAEIELSYKFTYKTVFNNGLTEHEIDHIFIGQFSGQPQINKDEVKAYSYVSISDIKKGIRENPENYTSWFKLIIKNI